MRNPRLVCLGLFMVGLTIGQASIAETPMTCMIESHESGGTLVLQAVLQAGTTEFIGEYRLSIQSTGRAGQSRSLQSGQVHLKPTERKALGTVSVVATGMNVAAELLARSADGHECVAHY